MAGIPFVAIGNDELAHRPRLRSGQWIACTHCRRRHWLKSGRTTDGRLDDRFLFYVCGSASYLAAIDGRSVIGMTLDGGTLKTGEEN